MTTTRIFPSEIGNKEPGSEATQPPVHTMKHTDLILDWFSRHSSITPMEALSNLGIYRLGARIYDLRERGHDIRTDRVEFRDRHGNTSRPARYVYLGKEE